MVYYVLMFVGIGFNVVAQLMLKTASKGLQVLNSSHELLQKIIFLIYNPYFWGALICYGIGFVVYSIVLSHMEISKAYPVSSVSAIILIYLTSIMFLHESTGPSKTAGLALCILGIMLILK